MVDSNPDYDGAMNRLLELYEGAKTWTSSRIDLPVATSMDDDSLQIINLADTLGKVGRPIPTVDDATCFFLPKEKYGVNTAKFRKKVLGPLFVYCCREAGFSVMMKGWESDRKCAKFICQRGKHYQPAKGSRSDPTQPSSQLPPPATNRVSTTGRPVKGKEHKCTCNFTVYWHSVMRRWYIPKMQKGCPDHVGHVPRTPEEIRLWSGALPQEEIELQQQMIRAQQRPRGVARLTYERTGIELEPYQVKYLRKKMRGQDLLANARIVHGQDLDPANFKPTVADRILLTLQSRSDVSYVVLCCLCVGQKENQYPWDKPRLRHCHRPW